MISDCFKEYCAGCGEIDHVEDGMFSEKWYPGRFMCGDCLNEERGEIEDRDIPLFEKPKGAIYSKEVLDYLIEKLLAGRGIVFVRRRWARGEHEGKLRLIARMNTEHPDKNFVSEYETQIRIKKITA